MSSSSSTTTTDAVGALPTTTTFLPVLDDLLSPDFRPVTHPVVTPLQTPSTTGPVQQQRSEPPKVIDKSEAAAKIQKWWWKLQQNDEVKKHSSGGGGEDLKHRIRHNRAEEYIRHLESEVMRLKQSLTAERKLRSLQFEAIRSLWSQVQKITANNNAGAQQSLLLMTQSLPNGLPPDVKPATTTTTSPPPVAVVQKCTCTTEIANLKLQLEQEMSELRKLVAASLAAPQSETASTTTATTESKVNKRPDTLDLGGNGVKHGELQGFADSVARSVVLQGVTTTNNTTTTSGDNNNSSSNTSSSKGDTATAAE